MKDKILISQYTTHSAETQKIADIEIKLKSYGGKIFQKAFDGYVNHLTATLVPESIKISASEEE